MGTADSEDEIPKGNALILANFHIDPATLSPEMWAVLFNQAVWLEGERIKNNAKMLTQLFGNNE